MGILAEPAAYIRKLKLPKGFSVCELGDQWITHGTRRLARDFYRELGCGRYESIDANGRGTIRYDLNRKWKGEYGVFDLVTDFGTGEHVFDQAQVWRTLHGLAKVGGFIAFDRPSQGYRAHCYYLTAPCLYDDLARANHYRVVRLETFSGTRGELERGVFQKLHADPFVTPQQGRYAKDLRWIGMRTA
jgi:hypothetical protein